MRHPLHLIVGVKSETSWREVNLNEYADADYGSWLGKRQPKMNPLLGPETCGKWVEELAKRKSVDCTYGGYMEDRSILWRGHYMKRGHFVHYGVDINVPVGTPVYCPRPCRVIEMFDSQDQNGGWGQRVLVQTDRGLVIFAHITAPFMLHVGISYAPNQMIGEVAPSTSNGGWYPHLHLQGLHSLDLLGNLDGYGKKYLKMELDYPNPLDILLPFPT